MEIDDDEEEEVENDVYVSPEQLAPELVGALFGHLCLLCGIRRFCVSQVTLSDSRGVSSSSDWRALLNIDVVRARNRPKNPVKCGRICVQMK